MTAARVIASNAQHAAAAIDAALRTDVAVVITLRMLETLIRELGSAERVQDVLSAAVKLRQRPLCVNLGLKTIVLKPDSWTDERAMGWLAGIHSDLEREFGEISSVSRSR